MSPPQHYESIYPFTPESGQSETVTKNANFFFL